MAYTAVITVSTGDLWTAANQNTYLRDNMTALAADRSIEIMLPAHSGWNQTDGNALTITAGQVFGLTLVDNKECYVIGSAYTPGRFVETMTIKVVCVPNGTGNIYGYTRVYGGAAGEAYNTIDINPGYATIAVTSGEIEIINSVTITGVADDDVIMPFYNRDAASANDTVNNYVEVVGFLLEYTEANYG